MMIATPSAFHRQVAIADDCAVHSRNIVRSEQAIINLDAALPTASIDTTAVTPRW